MRTIAIVFGDNDFGRTFRPLLETIHRAYVWNNGLTRDVVETAIRTGIEFHYIAFQAAKYFDKNEVEKLERRVSYLNQIRILFDEEAEADICTPGGRNHAAWYLELTTGMVYSY